MNEQITAQKPADLMRYLEKSRSAIAMALPKHLTPDRMMRLALTCFSTNPALRQCTPQSILASIVVASQVGLEIGIGGQGYLIPYGKNCTFVPGWQGLVGLLNNTGRATAWTGAVFEGDEWEFELGSTPKCRHIPGENFGNPDAMTWVYACGKVNGSEQPIVEAWPMKRIWHHRDRFNKVGQRHYSYEHPEMYARKVVLLQVLKYMPKSIELQNAMTAAAAADMGHSVRTENGVVIDVGEVQEEARSLPSTERAPFPTERTEAPAAQPESVAQSVAYVETVEYVGAKIVNSPEGEKPVWQMAEVNYINPSGKPESARSFSKTLAAKVGRIEDGEFIPQFEAGQFLNLTVKTAEHAKHGKIFTGIELQEGSES